LFLVLDPTRCVDASLFKCLIIDSSTGLYNWDPYFISLGLLVGSQVQMAKGLVEHCIFEIKHPNKILNGSRSYYLARLQPPFLTEIVLQIYN